MHVDTELNNLVWKVRKVLLVMIYMQNYHLSVLASFSTVFCQM